MPRATHQAYGHGMRVFDVRFSPIDPMLLASASDDTTARVWRIEPSGSVRQVRSKRARVGEEVGSVGHAQPSKAAKVLVLLIWTHTCTAMHGQPCSATAGGGPPPLHASRWLHQPWVQPWVSVGHLHSAALGLLVV